MKVYIVKDYHEMSKKAASIIAVQAAMDPDSVLGLATGSTPVGAYEYLRKWSEEGTLDFSGIRTVNLDEYKGIAKESDQSYYHFMRENLFDHINVKEENTYIPDGEKEKIFDKFYCGQHKIADNRRSLGLGLFLCRAIVEAHGGTIGVTDRDPHGAVFGFTLPLEEVVLHE